MNVDTRFFVRKRFKDYYWQAKVAAPAEVHRREFGVGTLEDKIKVRHKAFKSEKELANYLKREAPSYISYSSAYYEFPENQPMSAKNWLGADLVFDLDAPMEYLDASVFEDVKNETINLVDFLVSDFGFNEKDVLINFSGSKGYHLHIPSEDVRPLSSEMRREIVDYVTGSGLDLKYFMGEIPVEGVVSDRRGDYIQAASVVRGPTEGDYGWAGRVYDAVHDFIEKSSLDDFRKIEGIGPKKAKKLYSDKERNLKALAGGNWEGLSDVALKIRQKIVDERAVRLMGDADKMVTLDTARLMRLPDTLHGGSGLQAKKVEKIEEFNPLVEAVVFSHGEIKVKLNEDIPKFDVMENKWGPYKKDETVATPEYVGIYLMLKDKAEKA